MESSRKQGKVVRRREVARCILNASLVGAVALMCALPLRRAHAQSTAASIHGQAPAGDEIVATSTTGFRHRTRVHANGKYVIHSLPLGTYSVKLMKNGKVLDKYHRVPLLVSGTRIVNFACPHDKCAAKNDNDS